MLQENAFHNLLFLLEKRRKRGEGPKQNKQEEREMEGGGCKRKKAATPDDCWGLKLVRSNLLTGGWGGLLSDTEAENSLLVYLGVFNTFRDTDRCTRKNSRAGNAHALNYS